VPAGALCAAADAIATTVLAIEITFLVAVLMLLATMLYLTPSCGDPECVRAHRHHAVMARVSNIERRHDELVVAAGTPHALVGMDDEVAESVPLLTLSTPHIGHFQIRTRGTLGGAIAHADPAAEYAAVALALDAVTLVAGERDLGHPRDGHVGIGADRIPGREVTGETAGDVVGGDRGRGGADEQKRGKKGSAHPANLNTRQGLGNFHSRSNLLSLCVPANNFLVGRGTGSDFPSHFHGPRSGPREVRAHSASDSTIFWKSIPTRK